jgi:hypothetical protein
MGSLKGSRFDLNDDWWNRSTIMESRKRLQGGEYTPLLTESRRREMRIPTPTEGIRRRREAGISSPAEVMRNQRKELRSAARSRVSSAWESEASLASSSHEDGSR